MELENLIGEKRMETLSEYKTPIIATAISTPGIALPLYFGAAGAIAGLFLFLGGWAYGTYAGMKHFD
jgi:hypothetical protein